MTNNVTYFYKISAVNSAGEGESSSAVSAKPESSVVTPPPGPEGQEVLPSWWWIIIILLIIVIVILTVLLLLKGRRGKPEEEPAEIADGTPEGTPSREDTVLEELEELGQDIPEGDEPTEPKDPLREF